MMTIRHARLEDASTIADLWNPMIRDTLATFTTVERSPADVSESLSARSAAGHPWLVASVGTRLAGFATCAPFRAGPGYVHTLEHTVILGPDFTRQGIGAHLMARLATEARGAGAHSLIGAISAANAPALRFHVRQGFLEVGRIPDAGRKFGRWLDLVLVQRRL